MLRRRRLARVTRVAFDGWRTGIGPRQRRAALRLAAAIRAAGAGSAPPSAVDADTPPPRIAVIAPVKANHTVNTNDAVAVAHHEQTRPQVRRQQVFAERRAEADLKVARRTVVAGWRGALTREIGLRQARQHHTLKRAARREPT